MSRHKLQRFEEMKSFPNAFEYPVEMKGKWRSDFFKNQHPLVLELGCGRGEYTIALSAMYPGKNFIGIDLKGSRLWKGAKTCLQQQQTNAAFIRSRIELIEHYFEAGEVDEIWITFPDPQPKDRWEPRRLTANNYLNIYRKLIKKDGIIHLKTDNTGLYEYTLEVIKTHGYELLFSQPDIYSLPEIEPILKVETTYEKIFKAKGETIKYVKFRIW